MGKSHRMHRSGPLTGPVCEADTRLKAICASGPLCCRGEMISQASHCPMNDPVTLSLLFSPPDALRMRRAGHTSMISRSTSARRKLAESRAQRPNRMRSFHIYAYHDIEFAPLYIFWFLAGLILETWSVAGLTIIGDCSYGQVRLAWHSKNEVVPGLRAARSGSTRVPGTRHLECHQELESFGRRTNCKAFLQQAPC
jgi:hypothetical protein